MPESIRALIAVLVLAVPAFFLSRRIAISAVALREFALWRTAWFAFTIAGFLSGNFFVFAVVAIIVCLYAHSVRGVTVGLYIVLLFTVPSSTTTIGIFGAINNLIELSNPRLLSIALLLPILFAVRSGRQNTNISVMPDRFIVAYALLSIGLEFRQANITSVMRGATELTLDILVPYFAFSRTVTTLANFRKVLLAFVVAVIPIALIAVAEIIKGWPLYHSIVVNWQGSATVGGREGMLRAGASAGSIPLGFIIVVAMGCWLGVSQKTNAASRKLERVVLAVLAAGLIATLSRGPWVGAAVLFATYIATGPSAIRKFVFYVMIGAVSLIFLLQIPAVHRLIDFLPFVGSVDVGNVTYRQLLFENSIAVIERNLWFGSVDYLMEPEMQQLMTGQNMVDLVNTYVGIALNNGLIGLSLFVSFFAAILVGLRRLLKLRTYNNIDFILYARTSIATLMAILVMIATTSSVSFIPYVYWSFAGLCVALIRMAYGSRSVMVPGVSAGMNRM